MKYIELFEIVADVINKAKVKLNLGQLENADLKQFRQTEQETDVKPHVDNLDNK